MNSIVDKDLPTYHNLSLLTDLQAPQKYISAPFTEAVAWASTSEWKLATAALPEWILFDILSKDMINLTQSNKVSFTPYLSLEVEWQLLKMDEAPLLKLCLMWMREMISMWKNK